MFGEVLVEVFEGLEHLVGYPHRDGVVGKLLIEVQEQHGSQRQFGGENARVDFKASVLEVLEKPAADDLGHEGPKRFRLSFRQLLHHKRVVVGCFFVLAGEGERRHHVRDDAVDGSGTVLRPIRFDLGIEIAEAIRLERRPLLVPEQLQQQGKHPDLRGLLF